MSEVLLHQVSTDKVWMNTSMMHTVSQSHSSLKAQPYSWISEKSFKNGHFLWPSSRISISLEHTLRVYVYTTHDDRVNQFNLAFFRYLFFGFTTLLGNAWVSSVIDDILCKIFFSEAQNQN